MRLFVYGGTFDPFHAGHRDILRWLARGGWADEIRVIPAGNPPHKKADRTAGETRARMLERALAAWDWAEAVRLDDREIRAGERPSYTLLTIRQLKREYPGARLYFVMGLDSLITFTKWYRWEELAQEMTLFIFARYAPEEAGGKPMEFSDARLHGRGPRLSAHPRVLWQGGKVKFSDGQGSSPDPKEITASHQVIRRAGGRLIYAAAPVRAVSSRQLRRELARGGGLNDIPAALRNQDLFQRTYLSGGGPS